MLVSAFTVVAVRGCQIAICKQSPANALTGESQRKKAPHSIDQTLRHCSLVKLGWCSSTIDPIKCSSGISKEFENTEQILCRDGSIVPWYRFDVFSFGFFVVQALAYKTHLHILKGLECIADWVTVRFEAQLCVDQWVVLHSCVVNLENLTPTWFEWPLSNASVSDRREQSCLIFDREQAYPCYVVWYTLWGSIGGTGTLKNVAWLPTSWFPNAVPCLWLSGTFNQRQQIGLNLCCAFAGVVGAITHCDPKSCARSSLSHVNSCQSMMQWQEGSNQHHPCWDIWRWSGYWSKRFRYLVFFLGDKHRFTSYLDVQCTRGSTHAQKYESVNLVWCWALCLDFTVAVG